ncbi:response regulator transcription factor [Cupriavidus sp. 30B13]|uniref:response regulator transcription factor n=1 Tax=Cupriavidus sp. 30B13 TaxID=3384241 RepID=UPI003B8ECDAB
MPRDEKTIHILDDDETVPWLYSKFLRIPDAAFRTYTSAAAFLAGYRPAPCECLICDLRMPEMDGLEVQRQLRNTGMSLPIIFVSGFAEVPSVVQAMKVGAFHFLEKPPDPAELHRLVVEALAHSRTLHAERVASAQRKARLTLLTPREREVAREVARGKSSRQIADEMGVSVRTVENHRAHLAEKLGVASVAELVRLVSGFDED